MLRLKQVRFILLCMLVSTPSQLFYKCYADLLNGDRSDVPSENAINKDGGSTSQEPSLTDRQRRDVAVDGDALEEETMQEQVRSLKSEVKDLKSHLVLLTDAIIDTSSGRQVRHPRNVNQATTVPDYFGSLSAYGNCTCRGDPGPVGPPGVPGRDGRDGRDAPIPCDRNFGSDQTSSPEPQSSAGDQTTGGRAGNGVYVRWGRTVCRDGSELVYQGVIGGPKYNEDGGGTNHQCLPLEPIYDIVVPGHQTSRGRMYGTEMENYEIPTDSEWLHLNNHSPLCAVCLSLQRPTVLMIPARNVCPSSDWTLEYNGQLMAAASASSHESTEHICVDRHPEVDPHTSSNSNKHLLYLVEVRCSDGGGLPCGPYVDGHELTCAVCSM